MWWLLAAVIRRWIACARRCGKRRNRSPVFIGATGRICRARKREVENAEEEGVQFEWLSAPRAFDGDGRVESVIAQSIHLGQPDETGRQVPQIIDGLTAACLLIWLLRHLALMLRICRPCSGKKT